MARWAVFDMDGTLLPGDSLEGIFMRHALRARLLPAWNVVAFILACLRDRDVWDAFRRDKTYLTGLSVSVVEKYAQSLFTRFILPALSPDGLRVMEERRRDHAVMVMTGAPDFLTRHLSEASAIDRAVCTMPEVCNGRYTGGIVGLHPYGERKRDILLALRNKLDIDFARSIVYANHHSDIPHMELFGEAVVVNPTVRLRWHARRHGWAVASWSRRRRD